jgi:hypothetical protein
MVMRFYFNVKEIGVRFPVSLQLGEVIKDDSVDERQEDTIKDDDGDDE